MKGRVSFLMCSKLPLIALFRHSLPFFVDVSVTFEPPLKVSLLRFKAAEANKKSEADFPSVEENFPHIYR